MDDFGPWKGLSWEVLKAPQRSSHVALRGKDFLLCQFRNRQKSPIWKGFSLPETYRNSIKLGVRFMDDPRGLANYKRGPRGTPSRIPRLPSRSTTLAQPLAAILYHSLSCGGFGEALQEFFLHHHHAV